MLTSADIHNKEFGRRFRGYSEDEVDAFLDEIVSDYDALIHENQRLKEEALSYIKRKEQFEHLEQHLQNALDVAQKTADEVLRNAKQQAEEMRRSVEQECANLRRQTDMELQQKIDEAEEKVRQEEILYEDTKGRRRQFLIKIKSLLKTELEILDEEGVRQAVGALEPLPEDELMEGFREPDLAEEKKEPPPEAEGPGDASAPSAGVSSLLAPEVSGVKASD